MKRPVYWQGLELFPWLKIRGLSVPFVRKSLERLPFSTQSVLILVYGSMLTIGTFVGRRLP
jgi:hypothetical protein